MNEHDAKFHLRAMRPGGADAKDPIFAEPLAAAERDPTLRAWLEREQALDVAVARKLAAIEPPAGLREAILAGGNASRRARAWWRQPRWLGMAATVAVLVALAVRFGGISGPAVQELAAFALHDLRQAHENHVGRPADLAGVRARLEGAASLRREFRPDLADLRRKGCRSVRLGGREVFELCFERDGVWFHLYAARGGQRESGRGLHFGETNGARPLAVAAWADARNTYALVTDAGREALRRVL